nr:hypothetical protein [uncultured Actinotalea sp.]
MTPTTARPARSVRPPTATRPRPATLRHVIAWLMGHHLRFVGWAVAVLVVGVVVGTILVERISQVELSIVQFGRQGFVWFPFAIAIGLATAYVPVHVAAGMTRRVMARASLLAGVLTGLTYAVVMTVALQAERAVYGAFGWPQRITDAAPLFEDTSQVGLILLDLSLLFVAAQLSGLLVGAVYYRFGGWRGTFALPLTVGPILAVPTLLTGGWWDLGLPVRALLAVGVLALCATAYAVVLQGARIRPAT